MLRWCLTCACVHYVWASLLTELQQYSTWNVAMHLKCGNAFEICDWKIFDFFDWSDNLDVLSHMCISFGSFVPHAAENCYVCCLCLFWALSLHKSTWVEDVRLSNLTLQQDNKRAPDLKSVFHAHIFRSDPPPPFLSTYMPIENSHGHMVNSPRTSPYVFGYFYQSTIDDLAWWRYVVAVFPHCSFISGLVLSDWSTLV